MLSLLDAALAYGVADPEGLLGRLLEDCLHWLAASPSRLWCSRAFAALSRCAAGGAERAVSE